MDYFYIYNIKQARFFLHKGLIPIDIGIGTKKEVFIKFIRDYNSEEVFLEWINRKT
jgi:hypothetical protein